MNPIYTCICSYTIVKLRDAHRNDYQVTISYEPSLIYQVAFPWELLNSFMPSGLFYHNSYGLVHFQ